MRLFHSGMVRQHAKVAVSPTCQHQRGNPVNHDQRGQDQWPDPPTTGELSWHRPGGVMCGTAQTLSSKLAYFPQNLRRLFGPGCIQQRSRGDLRVPRS